MKKITFFLVTSFILCCFQLHSIEAKQLKVVTSLPSLASLTEAVGKQHVSVTSITRGVQDAHYIEAKPSYMVKLSRADLLIYSGMELEIGWLPLLIQGSRNKRIAIGSRGILNASQALSPEDILEKPRGDVDRTMGDVHPHGNPHYLLNPHNALKVTRLITEKLSDLDPDHRADYEHNREIFEQDLQSKIEKWQNQTTSFRNKEVICYHSHWSYLLDWLQLKIAGYIELRPGIPPTPKHRHEIEQLVVDRNIAAILISSWKEPTKASIIAQNSNATLLILPGEVQAVPGTDNYVTWIEYMIDQLLMAFPTLDKPEQS